ncbi:hypothetical protein N7454_010393 [Penicillium verhagenii]|nr:hypothetical protein N7454_010393 [Penicillium verhagenii]
MILTLFISIQFYGDRTSKPPSVREVVDPNKLTHLFFNPQRVPRVLAEVVETPAFMEAMRGLWMDARTLQEHKYLPYGIQSSYLSKNKIRCFYCYLLRKDYRLYKNYTKKGLEQLQRDSTPSNAVPPPESFVLPPKKVKPERDWDPTTPYVPEPIVGDDKPKMLYFPFFESQDVPGKFGFWFLGSSKIEHKLWVEDQTAPIPECLYHPGEAINDVSQMPLKLLHQGYQRYGDGWRFESGHIGDSERLITPTHRSGVVVSCKTGINRRGDQELIRLSAVDLYSGEVLLDHLVWPKAPMLHLDTQRSCITWKMMNDAHEKGLCLNGIEEAQERLWEYVNRETYIVFHQGRDDMIHLRWRFQDQRIIDTFELEGRREVPERNRSLKNLSRLHLSRDIQRTRFGLDSLEDAMATRDLVFWYAENLPAEKMREMKHYAQYRAQKEICSLPSETRDAREGEQEFKTLCRLGFNHEADQWPDPYGTAQAQAQHNNADGRNVW